MEQTVPQGQEKSLLDEIVGHLKVAKGPDARGEYLAWCPFHPDGEGKPPHQPNLYVSERGFICHACGEKGSLRRLATKAGVTCQTGETTEQICYDYEDENHNLLYQVVRRPGKRFFQRRPDERGGWINDLKGVRRVLYRLAELRERPDEPVYVVEGEKDANRLRSIGLIATTNSGGAGKWHDDYSQILAGRDVIIIPDNDEPGRQHAEAVARSLAGKATSIRVLSLPGLGPKGDVSDFLSSGKTSKDLLAIAEATGHWSPGGSVVASGMSDDEPCEDTPPARNDKPPSVATVIVQIAEQEGLELFHDERGAAYVRLEIGTKRQILAVAGREFETYLGRLAWNRLGKVAGSEAIRSAKATLEGKAIYEGPTHELHCRVARVGEEIWIDLDGVRAVKVGPDNWEVVERPPILFRPNPHNRPLPEPVRGGDPLAILKFTKIEDEQVGLLLAVFLVACMYPDIPCPLLVVHGVQGASKSTLQRMLKRLIDPHEVELRGLPNDINEYVLIAWHNRCIAFDNLTSMPPWLSDAMCRTVTGSGLEKRKLYTDDTAMVYRFQRPLMLAGINLVAQSPDLLDRSIIVELSPIPPAQRRPEREMWEEFDVAAPRIFGGQLDVLAKVMQILPSIRLDSYPRMADFARVGVAAAIALGKTADDFLAAYERNVTRQSDASMESSVVAQALLELMERHGEEWSGTASDLLGALKRVADDLNIDTKYRFWPKHPNVLSRRLKELEPPLRAHGLVVVHTRTGNERRVTIRRVREHVVDGAASEADSLAERQAKVTECDAGKRDVVIQQQLDFTTFSTNSDDSDDILRLFRGVEDLPRDWAGWGTAVQYQFQQRLARLLNAGIPEGEARNAAREEIMALWERVVEIRLGMGHFPG